jgi:DnaJ-class molecular chaperone
MSTCENCNGYGSIKCPQCEGVGRTYKPRLLSFWTIFCLPCNGSGKTRCPHCYGSGYIV